MGLFEAGKYETLIKEYAFLFTESVHPYLPKSVIAIYRKTGILLYRFLFIVIYRSHRRLEFHPRKIVHSFWNASDKPLQFVDCFFNQNFEDYLEDLFHKTIPEIVHKNLNLLNQLLQTK